MRAFRPAAGRTSCCSHPRTIEGLPVSLTWPEWSPDGRYFVYIQQSGPTGASVWVKPASGAGQAQMIVKPETPTGKIAFARISPDGKWLAYSADDGGREEVYVTSFPKWQRSLADYARGWNSFRYGEAMEKRSTTSGTIPISMLWK